MPANIIKTKYMKPKIDLLSARNRSASCQKTPQRKKLSLLKDLKLANHEQQLHSSEKRPLQELGGCPSRQEERFKKIKIHPIMGCNTKDYNSSRRTSTTLSIMSMLSLSGTSNGLPRSRLWNIDSPINLLMLD